MTETFDDKVTAFYSGDEKERAITILREVLNGMSAEKLDGRGTAQHMLGPVATMVPASFMFAFTCLKKEELESLSEISATILLPAMVTFAVASFGVQRNQVEEMITHISESHENIHTFSTIANFLLIYLSRARDNLVAEHKPETAEYIEQLQKSIVTVSNLRDKYLKKET